MQCPLFSIAEARGHALRTYLPTYAVPFPSRPETTNQRPPTNATTTHQATHHSSTWAT